MSKSDSAAAVLPFVSEQQIFERVHSHLKYTRGKNWGSATNFDKYLSLALTIRDLAVDKMLATMGAYQHNNVKRLYYLSMEFLMGRMLNNNMTALMACDAAKKALARMQLDLETLCQCESDAALGNGGLGRLAACFLDSMATMELPAYGYGLRYEHGMFKQELENGWQRERPDEWLKYHYPWEMVRPEHTIPVLIYGHIEKARDPSGKTRPIWVDWQLFEGLPYDIPIIGYDVNTVNFLRLWCSRAHEGFRLDVFNQGDYVNATQQKNWAEIVTKVLYPSDNTSAGKELRLIQEYFLVTCSLRDIIRRFQKNNKNWHDFPKKNAIQLNDTHPVLAVVELMRFFIDEINLPWETAWDIVARTMSYTNHTILPEALEKWSVPLLEHVLPRHLSLIYEINARFLQKAELRFPGDQERLQRLSLIEETDPKQVRMANLAIAGSYAVNGVSALHSRLLKDYTFRDFWEMWPEKFHNKTNGVTPRRWLLLCNPQFSNLITEAIGNSWIKDLTQLQNLEPLAEDAGFRQAFLNIKHGNKLRLAKHIRQVTGEKIDPESLFDVQIKRLHEYKRQLLNLMHIITLFHRIKNNPRLNILPRTFIFGAKAAPSYTMAKHIIKLISSLSERINADSDVRDRLKVIFLPDYDVSLAEIIIPAADLSEQISTAGMEASGTGNMKLALNGALTIGTWDGANIEIAEAVGLDNIFIFGHRAEQIAAMRSHYNPYEFYHKDNELKDVVDSLLGRDFCPAQSGLFASIHQSLLEHGDYYFHLADYRMYIDTQEKEVARLFQTPNAWSKKALLNVARMGYFSSDRTIAEYARDIWKIKPQAVRLKDIEFAKTYIQNGD